MTDRQKRIMEKESMRPDKVIQLTDGYLKDLREKGATLAEAKAVAHRMIRILLESERRRPETLLSDITLAGSSEGKEGQVG